MQKRYLNGLCICVFDCVRCGKYLSTSNPPRAAEKTPRILRRNMYLITKQNKTNCAKIEDRKKNIIEKKNGGRGRVVGQKPI